MDVLGCGQKARNPMRQKINKIKIGIIGLGGAGIGHIRRFKRNKLVSEVIGYDSKENKNLGLKTIKDFEKFLFSVDAVSICTPDNTHFEYIKHCMDSKKHVLVEKPMVSSYKEALSLGEYIKNHPQLKFGVHHQMRMVPAFVRAKQLLDQNMLGKVFYIEANYWHDMRQRNTMYDDWRIKGKGQSIIFGAACHPLDLILYLVPDEIESHKTFINKNAYQNYPSPYTSATTILKFKTKVVAKSHTNNGCNFPQFNNLVILGDQGTYIDGILYKNDKIKILEQFEELPPFHPLNLLRKIGRKLINNLSTKFSLFRLTPFSVYAHEFASQSIINNFVDSIVNEVPISVGYEDGLRVIKVCEETENDGLSS